MIDEEMVDEPMVVGTIQFYNKIGGEITQEDLARIMHVRKLIGSMLIKCEYITNTLQTVVGFAEESERFN